MYLLCAVAVLAMAAQVSLAANDFTNGGGDGKWNNAANWLNGVPVMQPVGSIGMAMINAGVCTIDNAPQGICQWLMIGDGGGTHGTLNVVNGATIGTPTWGPGETYMGRHNGVGIMNISGAGSIVQSEGWRIGINTVGTPQGYAIVNISNGGIGDGIWWENHINKSGKIVIWDGGLFRVRGGAAFTVDGLIDIKGGVLALEGDRSDLLQMLVDAEKIVGYGGAVTPTVTFDGAFTNVTVPEPITIALLGLGGLFLRRRIA